MSSERERERREKGRGGGELGEGSMFREQEKEQSRQMGRKIDVGSF